MTTKNLSFILIKAIVILICFAAFIYFLFFTELGSQSLSRFVLKRYLKAKQISYQKAEGSFNDEFSLHDVVIENAKNLPPGAVIKIQRIDVRMDKFKLSQLIVNIHNGRLKLPFSDTILFYGEYVRGKIDLNIYSKKVSAREIIDLFAHKKLLSTLSGVFTDVNLHIAGVQNELAIAGNFHIEKIIKESLSLTDCKGSILMYCDDLFESLSLNGEIVLKNGIASGRNTADIKLQTSKIIYESDPKHPKLNIRGKATVDDVKITAILQGTFDQPDLRLSSYPPLTEDLLLVMLATGRSWGTKSLAAGQRKVPANLVRDFVDYFIFGGRGTEIAKRLGISDISLTYDQQTKGMGVKTSIVDKVDLKYEVEPPQQEKGQALPKQTVGTEVKITDTVSVGAEKELQQKTTQDIGSDNKEQEEKVYLQFKKQF
jgi:hypothetical protein